MKQLLSIFLALLLLVFCVSCDQEQEGSTNSSELDGPYTASLPEASTDTDFVQFTMKDGSTFVVQLYPDMAPETVANFKELVASGFYDGLDFYRMDAHMIQGGAPRSGEDAPETVTGEFAQNGYTNNSLTHTRGTLSMVRNATDYNSASCRFFIVHQDMTSLDGHYAAFGRVVAGMETVDIIAASEVTEQIYTHEKSAPVDPPIIQSAYFVDYTAE